MQIKPEFKKVYFDMDGVLVDFYSHLQDLHGQTIEALVKQGAEDAVGLMMDAHMPKKPFITTPPTEEFYALVNWMEYLKTKNISPEILTSISPRSYNQDILEQKKVWLKNHNLGNLPVHFVTTSEAKGAYGATGLILIDDDLRSISSFERNKGKGILHNNWDESYLKIQEIFPDYIFETIKKFSTTRKYRL